MSTEIKEDDNVIFKAISGFVEDLGSCFAKKQKSLALYARLISKTTPSHKSAMTRHINAFKKFCVFNRKQINEKNSSFNQKKIVFSERVYINMEHLFKKADMEEKGAMWRHLLTISALVDKESNAKEVLKNSKGAEGDMIHQAFSDITNIMNDQSIDKTDPMGAAMSLLSNGAVGNLFNGITSGFKEGNLDLGKLMGSLKDVISGIEDNIKEDQKGEEKEVVEVKKEVTSEKKEVIEEVENETKNEVVEEVEAEAKKEVK